MSKQDHHTADAARLGACHYVLLMLLQRLNARQPELLEELLAGVGADLQAIAAQGEPPAHVHAILEEAQQLISHAAAHPQP